MWGCHICTTVVEDVHIQDVHANKRVQAGNDYLGKHCLPPSEWPAPVGTSKVFQAIETKVRIVTV